MKDGFLHGLDAVLNPCSVAVIGASSGFGKWGQLILSNIVAGGFEGQIYPVNPRERSLCGLPVYENVEQIPGHVDLVFITTPADTVPEILKSCARKGVRGAVVITSGFSEIGMAGKDLEGRVASICRENGITLVGPNTMGIIRPHAKLFATGSHTRPAKGPVAFISQSGNLGNQLIHWAQQQGIGVSAFLGSGNEAMLGCAEYLESLKDDPFTKIIILYLESVGNGGRFLEVSREVNRSKPIVVLKGGRTDAGRSAAVSHTGAMMGETSVFSSVCRQAGILEAMVPSKLLALSAGFSALPLPKGNRVGIVTLGGGWGVVTADACNEKGLVVPRIPERIVEAIGRYLPPFWSRGNPVDLVGTRDLEVPVVAVEELVKWDGIDAVLSLGIVGRIELVRLLVESTRLADPTASSDFLKQIEDLSAGYEKQYTEKMVDLMERYGKPIIGVSLTSTGDRTVYPVEGKRYSGVFFQTPETAVSVLSAMVAYQRSVSIEEPGAR